MNRNMNGTKIAGGIFLICLLSACGGDGKKKQSDAGVADARPPDASSGIDFGLDKNKPVNQLTPDERVQACEALQDFSAGFTEQITPKLCKITGVLAVFGRNPPPAAGTCDQAVNACLLLSMGDAGAPPATTNMCGAVQTNCMATVGEVEQCTNDTLTVVNAYLDLWPSCAQLAAGLGSVPFQIPSDPPSCTSIKPKCPDLPLLSELLQGVLAGGALGR